VGFLGLTGVMTKNTAKIIGYIRTSTNKQDLKNQQHEIFSYTNKHDLKVHEFIEVQDSSRKTSKQRRVDELLQKLSSHDTLIVTELSRLGRSTSEILTLVNELIKNKVTLIVLKQNVTVTATKYDITSKVMLTFFSLFGELERDMVSLRTKESLSAKKAQGVKLGKPVGTIQKSKFDKDIEKIKELLQYGLSVRKIAKHMGYPNYISLNKYLNKRHIKEAVII